jgi:hypothetical protein
MRRTISLTVFLCPVLLFLLPSKPAASAQISAPSVTSEVVWNPSPEILAAIREKCGKGDPGNLNNCFLTEMRAAGASQQAVAFAKAIVDNGLFYARAFRKGGPVDIAYIQYPFRANELDGVLFVNGDPAIIDVDSEKFASQSNFSKDPIYAALAKKHPQISIWPGDRYHTNKPLEKGLGSGQELFVVEYILRDGCHACAQIGTVSLNFTFDKQGRFTGIQAPPAVSIH